MRKTLGQIIRELRDKLDVSLREFAKLIGVTPAHLSDIELGRRYPSPELLERIAKRLKVAVADLQQYDSRPPMDDIRRLSEADPAFGFAFRQLVDDVNSKKLTAQEMLESLKKQAPSEGEEQ